MKCLVDYDFVIKYKCIVVLGSVNPHGSWYLPFCVIGWLYLSPVFSAFKVGGGIERRLAVRLVHVQIKGTFLVCFVYQSISFCGHFTFQAWEINHSFFQLIYAAC